MKKVLIILTALTLAGVGAHAQQAPVMKQSTSTTNNRQANPVRPKIKKTNPNQNREVPLDTAQPGRRQLRPDSLRRGGATRVDTIR